MVARITSLKSISKALNYNEQKVQSGVAVLIEAVGFLKDAEQLSFHDKMNHFQRLQTLNERVVTNTLHVSLNFDPSEQLTDEKLQEIAAAYMNGIGFGKQPYLVYRHEDAGHPHIHIVSTNIQTDGSRISMHNLGCNQSEIARKDIEQRFGLCRAEDRAAALPIQPLSASRISYGKGTLKQAISNVLGTVLNQYNYTSLEQLNAVLKLYNLKAEKGEPGSRLNRYHGLQYQVLDEKGEKVGLPIKASSFHSRPTLSFLERRFRENEPLRSKIIPRTRQALDWILQKRFPSLEALEATVEKEGIHLVRRQNKDGLLYGITYVDVKNKGVVNGSELGKAYSAKGILEKLGLSPTIIRQEQFNQPELTSLRPSEKPVIVSATPIHSNWNMLEQLMLPEEERDEVAQPFKKKKRKKKRQI